MRLPVGCSVRNGRAALVLLLVNTIVTYCVFQSILPPALERLQQKPGHTSWQSGKQLKHFIPREKSAYVDRGGNPARAAAVAALLQQSNTDVDAAGDARQQHQQQPGRAATVLDSRPQALAARSRRHVPLVQFARLVADKETSLPSEKPNTVAQATARQRASSYGGLFDYKGVSGSMWARAFYFDEHSIGIVLLRPPRALRRQVCKYRGINAKAMDFKGSMGESHGAPVDKLTVICHFAESIPRPDSFSAGSEDYVEIWDAPKVPIFAYDIAKPFTWSVCVPPIHVNARYEWITQLLRFYINRLSAEYFFFYSSIGDLSTARMTELGVDLAEQYSSVIDISSQMQYKPYYFAETTAIHDCLFLNRHLGTEWTLFQDLDELLVLPTKWPDPMAFFENHKDKHAITFGMWSVDSRVCRPESEVEATDQDWPLIVRMRKATRGPYCGNMCIDWRGRRKYVVQPTLVDALFIHKPIARPMLNLPVSEGFMRNFWRAQNKDVQYCSQIDSSKL